ncbi:MAG: hypothetical protein HYZ45_03090 [Burkholderiales bacterium]|nr:hypothetical protein [Burkholderiales bacterium]
MVKTVQKVGHKARLKMQNLVIHLLKASAAWVGYTGALLVAPLLVRGYARAYARASLFASVREA